MAVNQLQKFEFFDKVFDIISSDFYAKCKFWEILEKYLKFMSELRKRTEDEKNAQFQNYREHRLT